ncbi:Hydroxymethylglutaryl-CoA lyase, mitochondrial [Hordeum vulgare]|nr:Hydroxymethylglutaryl-CoA lyase, mitochondrial [Hordeum vulgare]
MDATNPNFVMEQRAIYDVISAQTSDRQQAAAAEVRLQEIAKENNTSCTFYAPLTNHQAARWNDDSQGATIFLVDTSTDDRQGANSWCLRYYLVACLLQPMQHSSQRVPRDDDDDDDGGGGMAGMMMT